MDLLLLILLVVGVFALAILPGIFWLWMLIDCLKNEPSEGNDKIIWVLVLIFANVIGALVYFFIRRPERLEMYGR